MKVQPRQYWFVKYNGDSIRWFHSKDAAWEFYHSEQFASYPESLTVRGRERLVEIENVIKLDAAG